MAETTCPVFRPTEQEFKSFRRYIEDVVDPIAGKAGLCKIIPPPGWAARRRDAAEEMCKSVHIPAPIRQCISSTRSNGVYSVNIVENPPMSLAEFKEYADKRAPFPSSTADAGCPGSAAVGVRRGRSGRVGPADAGTASGAAGGGGGSKGGRGYGGGYGAGYGGGRSGAPASGDAGVGTSAEESEVARRVRMFWRSLGPNSEAPLYGADTLGTLFAADDDDAWNVAKLDTILQLLKANLPGITTPMLYAGMWRSMFAFHVEDVNLYSINYLHRGDPKSWYGIPPGSRQRFESLAQAFFTEEFHACKHHMRHKTSMISPLQIQKAGIGYCTAIQEAGEFMITFPGSYHGGFNHGFNLAESTNFALDRWIREGRGAGYCRCSPHSVRIDVDRFETLVRQHRRIAGKDSTCLNGLAEAPAGNIVPFASQENGKSSSDGLIDARSPVVLNAAAKSPPRENDGGGGGGGGSGGGSVGNGVEGREDSQESDSGSGSDDEEEERWEVEQDVQVFHCVCSNTRAVRRVRWTEDGGFVPMPFGKGSSGTSSTTADAAAAAAWPEDQECAECPRCGVWGHKACLEYVVPPQYAIPGAGEGYSAIAAAPPCSNGVPAPGEEELRDKSEASAAEDTLEHSPSAAGGDKNQDGAGVCKPATPPATTPVPPPRPVCWMCMQEKTEVAAMEAGMGGGGEAAASAPRRSGKSSGGSNSGAGGGGGGVCGSSRGGRGDGGGSAKKKTSKKMQGKRKSGGADGGAGEKGAETKAGKRTRKGEADGSGGSTAAGGKKSGTSASPSQAGVKTADPAASGASKRARVGPRLLGKEVLVSDGVAAVLTGVVTAIEAGQARVHYRGRKAKLDEWIDVRSERFLSAAEAKKQIELTHLAMNPNTAAAPASPSGTVGKKRKAASVNGVKPAAAAASSGKRPKSGGDGGGVGKSGTKKGGGGKRSKAETPSGDGEKVTSGVSKANTKENKLAGGGGATAKKGKKPLVGGNKPPGGARKGAAADRSKLSRKANGTMKAVTTPAQLKTSAGGHSKKDGEGSSGSGGAKPSEKKEKKPKKPKKPKTGSSIKPVVIAPPVVVQREAPKHHVISSRRAAVLARTFAKEAEEAQKDFEEAVAAAERSRLARQQRRKPSSSPRGFTSPPPQPLSSQCAASAAALAPGAGASGAAPHPADEAIPAAPAGVTERWPDLGFGGRPWGVGPFCRYHVGPDACATWTSRAGGAPSSGSGWVRQEDGASGQPHVEGGGGGGRGEEPGEEGEEGDGGMHSATDERLQGPLREMRRARVEFGQAVDLGEEGPFREWLARLQAVQHIPIGLVEKCSRALAVLLGTSPPDGSIRASLRALLVAESTRGGASQEVAAFVRSLAGLMADAASKVRPLSQPVAPPADAEGTSHDHTSWHSSAAQSQGASTAAGDNADSDGNGAYPAAASIRDEEGAAAYGRALAHLARERSKQKQAAARAVQEKAEAEAAVAAAAAGLEKARNSNKGNKSRRIARAARRHLETVEAAEALVLPSSQVPPPAVVGTIPGGYPFSRSGETWLMHTKAMVGLKRTERWVTAWLNAPPPSPPRAGEPRAVGPRKPMASSSKLQKQRAQEEESKKAVAEVEAIEKNPSPFGAGGASFVPSVGASPCVAAAAAAAASARQSPSVAAAGVIGWQNAFVPLQRYPPPAPGIAAAVLSAAPAAPAAPLAACQTPVAGSAAPACGAASAASPAVVHPRPYGGLSTNSAAYNALLSWWSPQLSAAASTAAGPPPAAPIAPPQGAATAAAAAYLTSGNRSRGHPAAGEVSAYLTSGDPGTAHPAADPNGVVGGATAGVDLLERWQRVGASAVVQAAQGASGERPDEDMVIVDV